MIVCDKDVDEELIYQMTYAFWENLDEAKAASTDINAWTNIDLGVSVSNAVPYHEGAIRYYKENGKMS